MFAYIIVRIARVQAVRSPGLNSLVLRMVLTTSLAVFLLVCQRYSEPDLSAFHDWVRTSAIPLNLSQPYSDDRDSILSFADSSRLVGVGELHGVHESFTVNSRVFKNLVERRGFTVLAVEAGLPEARAVNDYVMSGRGEAESALKNLHYWTVSTTELIEWMRQYNRDPRNLHKLKFYGFDMQMTAAAAANVHAYLERVDPVLAQ